MCVCVDLIRECMSENTVNSMVIDIHLFLNGTFQVSIVFADVHEYYILYASLNLFPALLDIPC